jgi:hypothetical protein
VAEQNVLGAVENRPFSASLNLRVGGVCAIVGAVSFGAVRLLNAGMPAEDGEATLEFVATRPGYALVQVTAFLAAVVGVIAMAALASSFTHAAAWLLGRAGVVSGMVGVAIFGFQSSSEGLALPELADAFQTAAPADQADLVRIAHAVSEVTQGPSLVALALLFGTSLVLLGSAIVKDTYPSAVGWAGALVGTAVVVAALGLYLSPGVVPDALLYGVLVSILAQLWLVAAGVLMLRRAARSG